jgi:hypothetical protein
MSSISPVGSDPTAVSGIEPVSGMSPPPVGYLHGTLDGIAGMLSMPTSDLRTALKSGQSIADLASAKGVSLSSIVQNVEQQVREQRVAQGKPPIDQSVLDAGVNRAVHRHRGHHQAQPTTPSPAGSPSSSSVDLLA